MNREAHPASSPWDDENPRTPSGLRSPGRGDWHVYVLQLAEERLFVGASLDVRESFAEHVSGNGGRVTARWPPVGFGPIAVSAPINVQAGDSEALRREIADLKRLVAAQLVVLLGVNSVRGGAEREMVTDDEGSIIMDQDLIHARDYDRTNADLDLVASKVATPLGLDFIQVRKHVDATLRDAKAPIAYSSFGPPKVLIDRSWNVSVNGTTLQHESLDTVAYNPYASPMHPRIKQNDWNVLFQNDADLAGANAGDDADIYPETDDGHDPQDVFVVAFAILALSSSTLAVCIFSTAVSMWLRNVSWVFPVVCLALALPVGIVMQMRQEAGPLNFVFVVVFTVTTALFMGYAAVKATAVPALIAFDLAVFMWGMGVMCAAGVMALAAFVWSKLTKGRHGLVLSTALGIAANVAVLVAMYILLPESSQRMLSTLIKVGFGIGYVIVTFACIAILLQQAWTIDVRANYVTKRVFLCVPASAPVALLCYGLGYGLYSCLAAVKFV